MRTFAAWECSDNGIQPDLRLLRVAAAFLAERDLAAAGRAADAAPPLRPPLREGALLTLLPRPEPLSLPPPVSAFTVAHARLSASFSDTPRVS